MDKMLLKGLINDKGRIKRTKMTKHHTEVAIKYGITFSEIFASPIITINPTSIIKMITEKPKMLKDEFFKNLIIFFIAPLLFQYFWPNSL